MDMPDGGAKGSGDGAASRLLSINASDASYGTLELPEEGSSGNQLGWFSGAFVPTMLGIFGVVTFLRMGWVVGEAGLLLSYLIVILGNCCTILTWSSLSAIATNGKMKGGGAYYMISRSLGPEFGGSIGLIFYLANVFGCGVYIKGFVEATQTAVADYIFYQNVAEYDYWLSVALGTMILIIITITCFFGASFFIKFLVIVYAIEVASLCYSLISFMFQSPDVIPGYTSWNTDTFVENLTPHYSPTDGQDQNFQTVFAVFFPAMAGIMGGANMSGDLKDPGTAIPRGTIVAILVAFLFYMVEMFVMAFTTQYTALTSYSIMQDISFGTPAIITIGIYCASLSSAISGMSGGARVIQALAADNLIPFIGIFAKGYGKGNEPVLATALTFFLVQILMFLPNLNTLATISSLFFLFSYSLTNLACFALQVAGAPNFRPSFKYFHWSSSAIGAILCFVSCFIVSYILATIALICILILFMYIYFFGPETEWGDVKQAIIFHQVRKFLLRLDIRKTHAKNWRPSILLMVNHPHNSISLIKFVNNLKKGGMYIIGTILPGECSAERIKSQTQTKNGYIDFISSSKIKAFDEVLISSSMLEGTHNLISTAGVGVMKPNTIVFGFPTNFREISESALADSPPSKFPQDRQEEHISNVEYVQCVYRALLFDKNVLLARNFKNYNEKSLAGGELTGRWGRKLAGGKRKRVDCWAIYPSHQDNFVNSPSITMTILFGWILSRSKFWKDHTNLRIITLSTASRKKEAVRMITKLLEYCRLEARVLVLLAEEEEATQNLTAEQRESSFLLSLPATQRNTIFNTLIKNHCSNTAIVFFPISAPSENPAEAEEYLKQLDILSNGIPCPSLLIRGSSNVITSEL